MDLSERSEMWVSVKEDRGEAGEERRRGHEVVKVNNKENNVNIRLTRAIRLIKSKH